MAQTSQQTQDIPQSRLSGKQTNGDWQLLVLCKKQMIENQTSGPAEAFLEAGFSLTLPFADLGT
jgi:hypothetical protein